MSGHRSDGAPYNPQGPHLTNTTGDLPPTPTEDDGHAPLPRSIVPSSPAQWTLTGPASSAGARRHQAPGPLERAIAAAHPMAPSASQGQGQASIPPSPSFAPAASASASVKTDVASVAAARVAAIQAQARAKIQSKSEMKSKSAAMAAAAAAAPIVATSKTSGSGSGSASSQRQQPSSPGSKARYKKRTKKYNNFNIFFMLERQLLLQSRGGGINSIETPIDTSDSPLTKHKGLHLPPLCRRYNHLPLTSNWFLELLANQNKKRPHRKSHGLIPFKELAQTVAKNYREIDDETQSFVNEVAERLGWHCEELEVIEERERQEEEVAARTRGIVSGLRGVLGPGHTFDAAAARIEGQLANSDSNSKKRKDAPVVSAKGAASGGINANASLSRDEAATVQQLMGMKTNSPPSGSSDYSAYAQGQGLPPGHANHHSGYPRALPPMPSPGVGPGAPGDNESDRLQFELARAMNARLESERRIQLLREQMTVHHARQHDQHQHAMQQQDQHQHQHNVARQQQQQHSHNQAAHSQAAAAAARPPSPRSALRASLPAGYEQYLSRMAGGSSPSVGSASVHNRHGGGPPPLASGQGAHTEPRPAARGSTTSPDLADLEKQLLKEALIRRLVPQGGGAQGPRHLLDSHLGSYLGTRSIDDEDTFARLTKRARYSEESDAGSKRSASGEDQAMSAPRADPLTGAASSARAPSASSDHPRSEEMGYYKEMYTKMVSRQGQHPQAPRDVAAAMGRDPAAVARDLAARDPYSAAARDLAYFDSLSANLPHQRHGGMPPYSSTDQGPSQHAFMDSRARGGLPHPPSHHLPPPPVPSSHNMPPYPQHPQGYGHPADNHSYSNILAQLAASRGAPGATSRGAPGVAQHDPTPPPTLQPAASESPAAMAAVAANLKSQFGLSYNDIMDVWKEMNEKKKNGEVGNSRDRDDAGGGNQEGKREE